MYRKKEIEQDIHDLTNEYWFIRLLISGPIMYFSFSLFNADMYNCVVHKSILSLEIIYNIEVNVLTLMRKQFKMLPLITFPFSHFLIDILSIFNILWMKQFAESAEIKNVSNKYDTFH